MKKLPLFESEEKTIMQEIGGDDSWSPKQKAVHLAKHLGHHDLAAHLEKQTGRSGTIMLARLKGLENEYMDKSKSEGAISEDTGGEISTPQELGKALKKYFKEKYGVTLSRTSYHKTVRGLDGSYYQVSTFNSGDTIPNEVRQKAVELVYKSNDWEKLNIKNPDDISYGNIGPRGISMYGSQWKTLLKG